MEAKLIKNELPRGYFLYDEKGYLIASTIKGYKKQPLSLKNCQAIERGYDLDELIEEVYPTPIFGLSIERKRERASFKAGFQKALGILGDKKFSEEELKQSMWDLGDALFNNCQNEIKEGEPQKYIDSIIQSLQQTEWDCIVEMEDATVVHLGGDNEIISQPKRDSDGCLILKRR